METQYIASKSRSQSRPGWSVIFHHPLRRKHGRPLRVRRGLGTRDEGEADRLTAQLNYLLSDDSFWTSLARERASREFDPVVVEIFYDSLDVHPSDPWDLRDQVMPFPAEEEGYARVKLLGPTGGGKTTLVRQLIGTDPRTERFPSTSTAKTTIFDTEIILKDGSFEAVVAFLDKDSTRFYIEECVTSAVVASAENRDEPEILRKLLEHNEQRFRLSYLLGTLPTDQDEMDDDVAESTEPAGLGFDEDASELTAEERDEMGGRLRRYLNEIRGLAEQMLDRTTQELELEMGQLSVEDRDAIFDLIEDELRRNPNAQSLIDEILDDVETRFDYVVDGEYQRDPIGWPILWTYRSNDRGAFIKAINRFSSNYAPNFGRLVTPLVEGIRVAGPFRPTWAREEEAPKVVLIDGEGLGHTPDSSAAIPTSITKRYERADVILLVDNSKQPVQAASLAVLRSLAASGHDTKLALVFTHFDQVKGDNLPNLTAKRNHVIASLDGAVSHIDSEISASFGDRLKRNLSDRVFFVGGIQNVLDEGARFTRGELSRLLQLFRTSSKKLAEVEGRPVYDLANLVLSIHRATASFQAYWNARLNLSTRPGSYPEHWTRVKALSRRFASQWKDHYDTLMPVADLIKMLQEPLAAFISSPREWDPARPIDEKAEVAMARVAQEVFSSLHQLAPDRLFRAAVKEWISAYERRGLGSTRLRARDIQGIFEVAAPIPSEIPTMESAEFLDRIRELFQEAASKAGARVR